MRTVIRTFHFSLVLFLVTAVCQGEIVIKKKSPRGKPGAKPGIVVPSPTGTVSVQHEDKLEFLNGDRLRGRISGGAKA